MFASIYFWFFLSIFHRPFPIPWVQKWQWTSKSGGSRFFFWKLPRVRSFFWHHPFFLGGGIWIFRFWGSQNFETQLRRARIPEMFGTPQGYPSFAWATNGKMKRFWAFFPYYHVSYQLSVSTYTFRDPQVWMSLGQHVVVDLIRLLKTLDQDVVDRHTVWYTHPDIFGYTHIFFCTIKTTWLQR